MTGTDQLEEHAALLRIRQRAHKRDTIILGSVFWMSVTAIVTLGLLEMIAGRSLFLTVAITTVLGAGYCAIWVRGEINRAEIELLDTLLREGTGH